MKAIQIQQTGGADVLRLTELELPAPTHGEVTVRLRACGVNYIDIYKRAGNYPVPLPLPGILGQEGAGEVEAIGEGVEGVRLGDRVSFCGVMGSYAQKINVPASALLNLPDEISFEQGAAFPLQGMTAHYLLHDYTPVRPGKSVLIHAAAGGVGLLYQVRA